MKDHGQLDEARNVGFEIRNPQRFVHNMARLVEETGRAATVFMKPHSMTGHFTLHDDLPHIFRTLAQLQQAWLRKPHKLFQAQIKLWYSYLDPWHYIDTTLSKFVTYRLTQVLACSVKRVVSGPAVAPGP